MTHTMAQSGLQLPSCYSIWSGWCVFVAVRIHLQRKIGYMYSNLFPESLKANSFTYAATLAHWGEPDEDYMWQHVDLGDQGYYYGFILYRPELHAKLPLTWEVRQCD